MHNYNHYLNLVNEAINNLRLPAQPAQLYNPISYTMALGGKRIRPVLTLITCEAMGGNPSDAVIAAIGIELFHNFTLKSTLKSSLTFSTCSMPQQWKSMKASNGTWNMKTATT